MYKYKDNDDNPKELFCKIKCLHTFTWERVQSDKAVPTWQINYANYVLQVQQQKQWQWGLKMCITTAWPIISNDCNFVKLYNVYNVFDMYICIN